MIIFHLKQGPIPLPLHPTTSTYPEEKALEELARQVRDKRRRYEVVERKEKIVARIRFVREREMPAPQWWWTWPELWRLQLRRARCLHIYLGQCQRGIRAYLSAVLGALKTISLHFLLRNSLGTLNESK